MASGLTRKVGPLPVWGWAGVLVGGVLVAVYLRRRAAASAGSSAVSAPTDTSSTVPSPASTPAVVDTSGGTGTVAAFDPTGLISSLLSGFETNVNAVTGLATSTTQAELGFQAQSYDFAQGVFGSALDFAKGAQATSTSTPKGTPGPPPPPSPPAAAPPPAPAPPSPTKYGGLYGPSIFAFK